MNRDLPTASHEIEQDVVLAESARPAYHAADAALEAGGGRGGVMDIQQIRETYAPDSSSSGLLWSEITQDVADLLAALKAAEFMYERAEARLEEGIKNLEWRKERTVAGGEQLFCPWCFGSPSHIAMNPHLAPTNGHRPRCALWGLLAALATAGGEGD